MRGPANADAEGADAGPVDSPTLRIDGVCVELGGRTVLSDASATADRGSFVGLVGPNGAGKTTLLRVVNGALSPARGSVTVAGERIRDLSSKAASRLVATVPQDTGVAFDFSVRETVEMGRTPHVSRFGRWDEDDRRAVETALDRTEVAGLADRPVTAVSGGERQRVLIARALAQDTPLLLLDEPTASLDINHQVRTLELVRALVDEGKTAVAAIHDLNLAAHYCDELVLLADGRVLAAGSPASVLTESTLERAFDTAAAVARHPVTGSVYVTAVPEGPSGDEQSGQVHVVGGGGSASRHLYLLSAAGYDVTVGALNEGDTDTETAHQLGLDAVTVPPYAPVDDDARAAVEERVRTADAVVVTDLEVSEGNLPNLKAAATADSLVVVEERPFRERNYAGEAGVRAYDVLRERGTVVPPTEVVSAVGDAATASGDATAVE